MPTNRGLVRPFASLQQPLPERRSYRLYEHRGGSVAGSGASLCRSWPGFDRYCRTTRYRRGLSLGLWQARTGKRPGSCGDIVRRYRAAARRFTVSALALLRQYRR
ncbi:hypothetical protein ABW21_db0205667 [Orbilia brochopaga]|nr:hypothetical protein ABW21_db0205667 [Drechslerella brochopaga]